MTEQRRIMLYLPDHLLSEVDGMLGEGEKNRSEFIIEATKYYLSHKKVKLRKKMCRGYQEMAVINLSLAQEALLSEEEVQLAFEKILEV